MNDDTVSDQSSKDTRFKPGVSGNPKGRPKRIPLPAAGLINGVLNAPTEYREGNQIKTATRLEVLIRAGMARAVAGDPKAALDLLMLRAHAQKFGDVAVHRIYINDWLPDYLGQTATQKTGESAQQREAPNTRWWE